MKNCAIAEDAATAALSEDFHQKAAEAHKPSACRFLPFVHPESSMFGNKAAAGICPSGLHCKKVCLRVQTIGLRVEVRIAWV